VAVNSDLKAIKADSLRAVEIMKSIIAEAQKQTNDSTHVQLIEQEDNKININQSPIIENVQDENDSPNVMPQNKIEAGAVTPIHPEKPVLKNNPPLKTTSAKPAATTKKKVAVKKTAVKKNESKKTDQKNEQQPKAVMPPKSDY
jgi:hypothetical protein